MTAYILDANVLIQASNGYYGFDFCPGFWRWLEMRSNVTGDVFSIDKVKNEIKNKKDDLSEWGKRVGGYFFKSTEDLCSAGDFQKIYDWAVGRNCKSSYINSFLEELTSGLFYMLFIMDLLLLRKKSQ